MKIDFLPEPELEFGTDRHIDIRFGLMNYGPFDYSNSSAPKEIRLGMVGTNETVEGVCKWLDKCQRGIDAKPSKQPNLFPRFPGYGSDSCFNSTLITNSQLQRTIPQREFDRVGQDADSNLVVSNAVHLFHTEMHYLLENNSVDVLICAPPMKLLERMHGRVEESEEETDNESFVSPHLDFHHLLKAKTMQLLRPLQIILPYTYDKSKQRSQKLRPDKVRQLQDEATRAWNIHTALYYKAGGTPWRLIHDPSQLTTCYIGISFYNSLDESTLRTSIAQVFNERGEGVIVRGGTATISKEDRQFHLEAEAAYSLITDALTRYRQEHRTLPARVVIHKSSTYNEAELDGFNQGLAQSSIDYADLISLTRSHTRLFRNGQYPPLRGSLLNLDDKIHVLYTKGSVDFFATYPGMYVPMPLKFRCELTEGTPKFLAEEILALTKMNWNNTQFDGSQPITLRAARQVGGILKYVGENERVEPRYSNYM